MRRITTLLLLLCCITGFGQVALFPANFDASVVEVPVQVINVQEIDPCNEEVTFDDYELFYNTYSTTPQIIANDITVAADMNFSVSRLTYNFLVESGVTITNADITFYTDNDGFPDQLIETQAVIPVSNVILDAFTDQDVIQVVFEIDPVLLDGQLGEETTYWVSYHVTLSGGALGAVQATNLSFNGYGATFTPDNGATWEVVFPDAEVVYLIEGECDLLGVETKTLDDFVIYPIPVNELLHIDTYQEFERISIYNILGQSVIEEKVGASSAQLDVSGLHAGTYLLRLTNSKNQHIVRKLIVE